MTAYRLLAVAILPIASIPAAAAQPPPVLVADVSRVDYPLHLLAVSLQGLANRRADAPAVFLITNARDAEWLTYSLRLAPRATRTVTVNELFDTLKPTLEGQILYDPDQPYTLDLATSAAALHEAVISPTDLGLPTVLDLRDRWPSAPDAYAWALDSLLPKCDSRRVAVIPPEAAVLRDFAIQHRMFTLSPAASPADPAVRDVLFSLLPGAVVYGTVPDPLRELINYRSHYVVSASNAANLSFFSRVTDEQPYYQYLGHVEPKAPRYLTFIFDCSDLGFVINDLPSLWEHPARGTLPLGWALPAALAEAAPLVLHRYYADAYRSGVDQFVLSPSGAGEMEVAAAPSAEAFFDATRSAQRALDAHTALYYTSSGLAGLEPAISQFITNTGVRGVFALPPSDFEPGFHSGVPVLSTPRIASAQEAMQYLDRIPLERRFVALYLDGRSLTPADAARIAAYAASRYVVVGPEELAQVMRGPAFAAEPSPGPPPVGSVEYAKDAQPNVPVPVKAVADSPEDIFELSVVYHPPNHPLAFSEPMVRTGEEYRAELPPLRCGGEFTLRLRAVDSQGGVRWSPEWSLQIPWSDTDEDGLSDAEEHFLLTDLTAADTDADGLLDGNDVYPLRFDQVAANYFGPITPPSDHPYLLDPGGSRVDLGDWPDGPPRGRQLHPGQSCTYWLPLRRLPPLSSAVIELDATGPAGIAVSADQVALTDEYIGTLTEPWHSRPLTAEEYPAGAFLRITCPAGVASSAADVLLIRSVSLVSPPGAPSITRVSVSPSYPGPEQPVTISALVFTPTGSVQPTISYRVNKGGIIAFPMQQVGWTQRYLARLPALDNRDELEWWITARDDQGNQTRTPRTVLPIGSWSRETVSLVPTREFAGEWSPVPDPAPAASGRQRGPTWHTDARLAPFDGLTDSAPVNLTGGNYSVWVLAGGRGKAIGVYIGDLKAGTVNPDLPDGWHLLGRVSLESGRHRVYLVAEPGPTPRPGAAPRYAAVVLTADRTFSPPDDQVVDIYNSLVLLSPSPDQTMTGRVELQATGAGNITAAEFSLDGEFLRRVFGPPFTLSLSTARFPNGPYTLRVDGMDRAGPTALTLEIPVTIAN